MKTPTTLAEAALALEQAFREIGGGNPRVIWMGRDEQRRVRIMVHYHGDQLVSCTKVEAWIIERGDTITVRSHVRDSQTIMQYSNRKTG